MNSRIVMLQKRPGICLVGMLEEPVKRNEGGLGALLLSPGVKTRVGPHGLYRKLAAAFLSRGIPVLRLDLEGFGDSDGEAPSELLEDIYRSVELGRHVDDVACALDRLETEEGLTRFVVGGLCGAAITGLHAAACDARIAALYAIGFPAILHGVPAPRDTTSPGSLRYARQVYLRKLFQPAAWLRLLSFQSDFRFMLRAFRRRAARRLAGDAVPSDLNPGIGPALAALFRGDRRALLIFGERDPLRFDYEDKFVPSYAAEIERYGTRLQVEIVPQANHVLGDPAAVEEAVRATGAWLDAHFAVRQPRVRSAGARIARPAYG